MLNSHVTGFANGDEVGRDIRRFPIAVELPKRDYVVNGKTGIAAGLARVIVSFSNFPRNLHPMRTPIHRLLTAAPIARMDPVVSLVGGPIEIGALGRAGITNAALECSHFLTALFTVPRYLAAAFLAFNIWPGLFRRVLASALVGAKPTRSTGPRFKFFPAPITGTFLFMVALCKCATAGRTEFIGAPVATLKRLSALFTSINLGEILTMINHTTSLVLVNARPRDGARRLACGACQRFMTPFKPVFIVSQMGNLYTI